jgi:hypothetical protein
MLGESSEIFIEISLQLYISFSPFCIFSPQVLIPRVLNSKLLAHEFQCQSLFPRTQCAISCSKSEKAFLKKWPWLLSCTEQIRIGPKRELEQLTKRQWLSREMILLLQEALGA